MDARLARILGFAGLSDVVVGLVLLVIGQTGDNRGVAVAGLAFLVAGAGVLTWIALARNRPTRL